MTHPHPIKEQRRYAIVQQARDYPLQFTYCGMRQHLDDARARAAELYRLDPNLIINIWCIDGTIVYGDKQSS